jgi:hypothetical protein
LHVLANNSEAQLKDEENNKTDDDISSDELSARPELSWLQALLPQVRGARAQIATAKLLTPTFSKRTLISL